MALAPVVRAAGIAEGPAKGQAAVGRGDRMASDIRAQAGSPKAARRVAPPPGLPRCAGEGCFGLVSMVRFLERCPAARDAPHSAAICAGGSSARRIGLV